MCVRNSKLVHDCKTVYTTFLVSKCLPDITLPRISLIVYGFLHTSERLPVDGTRSRMACHLSAPAYINFIMFSLFFLPLYKGQFVNDIAARHRIKTLNNADYKNLSFLMKPAKPCIVKWRRDVVVLSFRIFQFPLSKSDTTLSFGDC